MSMQVGTSALPMDKIETRSLCRTCILTGTELQWESDANTKCESNLTLMPFMTVLQSVNDLTESDVKHIVNQLHFNLSSPSIGYVQDTLQ